MTILKIYRKLLHYLKYYKGVTSGNIVLPTALVDLPLSVFLARQFRHQKTVRTGCLKLWKGQLADNLTREEFLPFHLDFPCCHQIHPSSSAIGARSHGHNPGNKSVEWADTHLRCVVKLTYRILKQIMEYTLLLKEDKAP